jgi:hypothetical protein
MTNMRHLINIVENTRVLTEDVIDLDDRRTERTHQAVKNSIDNSLSVSMGMQPFEQSINNLLGHEDTGRPFAPTAFSAMIGRTDSDQWNGGALFPRDLYPNTRILNIYDLRVPPEKQRNGSGKEAIERVCLYCDQNDLVATITISGNPRAQESYLVKMLPQFGFIFYPPSPEFIKDLKAKIRAMNGLGATHLPKGVFVRPVGGRK